MDVPLDLPHKSSHALTYLFVHLTWAVAHRCSRLDPSMDALLERVLDAKARDLHCRLLAFGAAVDHVHVLLRVPPTLSIADVAQGLKGVSARAVNFACGERVVRWQTGYFAESVSRTHLRTRADYVCGQREKHGASRTAADPIEEHPAKS